MMFNEVIANKYFKDEEKDNLTGILKIYQTGCKHIEVN